MSIVLTIASPIVGTQKGGFAKLYFDLAQSEGFFGGGKQCVNEFFISLKNISLPMFDETKAYFALGTEDSYTGGGFSCIRNFFY